MTMTKNAPTLAERKSALLDEARVITDGAKAATRDLTSDEATRVEAILTELDDVNDLLAKAAKSADLFRALDSMGNAEPLTNDPGLSGRTGLFTTAEAKALADAVSQKTNYAVTVPLASKHLKAAMVTTPLNLPPAGESVVTAPEPQAATALRDLFLVTEAKGPSERWYSMTNPEAGDVDIVAEGGLKPESGITYTPHDSSMVKIATRYSLTTEMSTDAPFMVQAVQMSVVRAVLARENKAHHGHDQRHVGHPHRVRAYGRPARHHRHRDR
ncbi:hypothetical protein G5V59_25670 [Nocardioides sp. W3-2-3]|uniref:hypothetical protein n=1 Tax=Nocardioides convexus TaxID=2712224 RepID=UPI0024182F4E|nr:hypothetical protein [Nocardioides convexus]NHA01890.1 hypothetical protein [Nocardioides convexus]